MTGPLRAVICPTSVLCLAVWSGGATAGFAAPPAQTPAQTPAQNPAQNPAKPPSNAANAIVEPQDLFTPDDQLIVEVDVAGQQITDGLAVYSSRAGLYLPLAGLTRLLDLAVQVDAAHRRAQGWTVSEKQGFLLELKDLTLSSGGRVIPVRAAQFAVADGDIYLRQDLLEQLLPVRVKAELRQLRLDVTPTQPLPFQQRLERERDRARLSHGPAQETVTRLETPYALYSPPGIDINVDATGGTRSGVASHFDVAAAGDLGYATAELFAGSAFRMKPDTLRILFERKDPAGRDVLVPGVTQAMVGDTYTPSLALGARGGSGRGVAISTAPLESVSVFDKTDIRGDLPAGYEVELYVNEVLRGSVPSSTDGRYAFTGVALAYGVNAIRLVFYGPHGERREEVRRINVGSGAVPAGQFVVNFGAVEENRPVVQLQKLGLGAVPGTRVVATLGYGLTREITLTSGLAEYRLASGSQRQLAVVGAATSVLGYALQAQGARDNAGATSLGFGAAGRILGFSTVLRQTDYFDGFIDEAQGGGGNQTRNTTFSLDGSVATPAGGLPVSLQATETHQTDGSRSYSVIFQTSKPVQRALVSAGLNYQGSDGGGVASTESVNGHLDLSGPVGGGWQLRSSAVFPISPSLHMGSLGVTAQRQVGPTTSVSLSAGHSFGESPDTLVNLGATLRLERANLTFSTGYDSARRDITFGIQLSTGLLFDPLQRRYRRVGAGAAAGGAAAVEAFVDGNGDGVRSPGEAPVPGLIVHGGRRDAVTDANGDALISGLGDSAGARIRLDADKLDNAYLTGPTAVVQVVPRPGRVVVIPFAMHATSEIELSAMFARGKAPLQALSSLALELVGEDGKVAAAGRTEYDGTLLLENVPAGAYQLRIEPEQAQRLHMRMQAPVVVRAPPEGGFAGRFRAVIELVEPPAAPAPTPAPAPSPAPASASPDPAAGTGSTRRTDGTTAIRSGAMSAPGRNMERPLILVSAHRAPNTGGTAHGRPQSRLHLDGQSELLLRIRDRTGDGDAFGSVGCRSAADGRGAQPALRPGCPQPGSGVGDLVEDRQGHPVPAVPCHAAAGFPAGRSGPAAEHPSRAGAGPCRGAGGAAGGPAAAAFRRAAGGAVRPDAVGSLHLPGSGRGHEPGRDRRSAGLVPGDGPGTCEGAAAEDRCREPEAAGADHHPDRRFGGGVSVMALSSCGGVQTHA